MAGVPACLCAGGSGGGGGGECTRKACRRHCCWYCCRCMYRVLGTRRMPCPALPCPSLRSLGRAGSALVAIPSLEERGFVLIALSSHLFRQHPGLAATKVPSPSSRIRATELSMASLRVAMRPLPRGMLPAVVCLLERYMRTLPVLDSIAVPRSSSSVLIHASLEKPAGRLVAVVGRRR